MKTKKTKTKTRACIRKKLKKKKTGNNYKTQEKHDFTSTYHHQTLLYTSYTRFTGADEVNNCCSLSQEFEDNPACVWPLGLDCIKEHKGLTGNKLSYSQWGCLRCPSQGQQKIEIKKPRTEKMSTKNTSESMIQKWRVKGPFLFKMLLYYPSCQLATS